MTTFLDTVADDTAAMLEGPFSVPVRWSGKSLRGIFDHAYRESQDVEGTHPAVTMASANVAGIAQGDAVNVDSVAYTVANVRPDGMGATVLVLEAT